MKANSCSRAVEVFIDCIPMTIPGLDFMDKCKASKILIQNWFYYILTSIQCTVFHAAKSSA